MINLNRLGGLIIQVILLIISLLYLRPGTGNIEYLNMYSISLYGAVISLVIWGLIIYESQSWTSNVSFIYLSFVLFQFGIPILYGVDHSYINEYMSLFSGNIINSGEMYTIFCIQLFGIGITLNYLSNKTRNHLIFAGTKWANNNELVVRAALFMFVISAIIYIPATLYGALILHSRISVNAIVGIAKQYYFPSAFLILCYSKNRTLIRVMYFMILFECVAGMLTGGRTEGLVPLMVFVVYFFNYRTSSNKGTHHRILRNILMFIALFVILFLLEYIAKARMSTSSVSASSLFSGNNFIESFVGELGFNFTSVLFVMEGISVTGLKYGGTYIGSFIGLIPETIDPLGIVKYYFNDISGSNWIQNTYGTKLGFGLGFSLIAESYYNFGYNGWIVVLIIGYLIGAFLSKKPNDCSNWEKYIELVLLMGFLTISRRDFYQLLKQLEYSIFVMALYIYIYSKLVKLTHR